MPPPAGGFNYTPLPSANQMQSSFAGLGGFGIGNLFNGQNSFLNTMRGGMNLAGDLMGLYSAFKQLGYNNDLMKMKKQQFNAGMSEYEAAKKRRSAFADTWQKSNDSLKIH